MFKRQLAILALGLFFCAQITPAQHATKSISEPTVFAPGIISTGDYEVCPQFSGDGKTFYFVKSTPDANFWTIVFSRFERGKLRSLHQLQPPRTMDQSQESRSADKLIRR